MTGGMNPQSKRVFIYAGWMYALWMVWCLLMMRWPTLFGAANLRAVVRLSVVLVPALLYAYRYGGFPRSDYFRLKQNWFSGITAGLMLVLIFLLVVFRGVSFRLPVRLPGGFAIWTNWILGSPFAEELFFRGVALREFLTSEGPSRAIALSAILFVVLHLPWWIISGEKYGMALFSGGLAMLEYGVVFACLVTVTRSLWAALIPHWCNNFVAVVTNA